jgi:hypothetical protein
MTEEQQANSDNDLSVDSEVTAADAAAEKRERSTIQFPYNDLDDAVTIVKAIHEHAGLSCTIDQLAAYTKQSMTSGAFRLRVGNAAMFGLTVNERGQVTLTELGRRIVDPEQEPAARADAFLQVALYQRIYDHYKGYTLPPAAALERFMRDSGVSPKQTDKARQAFQRSARQAGYFAHGEDRLVRPASPGTRPQDSAPVAELPSHIERFGGGGGGGSGGDGESGLTLDPLLLALLKKVPPAGKEWSGSQRVRWFRTFAMNVSQVYDSDENPIEMDISLTDPAS